MKDIPELKRTLQTELGKHRNRLKVHEYMDIVQESDMTHAGYINFGISFLKSGARVNVKSIALVAYLQKARQYDKIGLSFNYSSN